MNVIKQFERDGALYEVVRIDSTTTVERRAAPDAPATGGDAVTTAESPDAPATGGAVSSSTDRSAPRRGRG